MVKWLRWHCPPDTGFEIRALAVWGRACYLSVTEAPHNTDFHTWMGKKHFCFFQTAEIGNRTPNSGVKGSGANHYPRAPAPCVSLTRSTLLVSENYSDLTKWRSILFTYCWLMSHFIFHKSKRWYLMCLYKMKTRIYAASAVKGLKATG